MPKRWQNAKNSTSQYMDKLWLTGRALGRVYNFRSGCMHTIHLLPGAAIQPNLELKTRPKPVLGSLPLAIALPAQSLIYHHATAGISLCRKLVCLSLIQWLLILGYCKQMRLSVLVPFTLV
jgi:hypothetical protein